MADITDSINTQNELEEEIRRKRIKELQEKLSKLPNNSKDREEIENELRELEQLEESEEKDPKKKEEENENEIQAESANLFGNHENLSLDNQTTRNSTSDKPEDPKPNDGKNRKKDESDSKKKEETKNSEDSEDIEVNEGELTDFFDWCLGGNHCLGYGEGSGEQNTNRLANEISTFVLGRLAGTGIGAALISTGVLAWLGAIVIAFSNTPNCVMDKLKEEVANKTMGTIPLNKIPNMSDELAKYAEKTTERKKEKIEKLKKLKQRGKEILHPEKNPENAPGFDPSKMSPENLAEQLQKMQGIAQQTQPKQQGQTPLKNIPKGGNSNDSNKQGNENNSKQITPPGGSLVGQLRDRSRKPRSDSNYRQ